MFIATCIDGLIQHFRLFLRLPRKSFSFHDPGVRAIMIFYKILWGPYLAVVDEVLGQKRKQFSVVKRKSCSDAYYPH